MNETEIEEVKLGRRSRHLPSHILESLLLNCICSILGFHITLPSKKCFHQMEVIAPMLSLFGWLWFLLTVFLRWPAFLVSRHFWCLLWTFTLNSFAHHLTSNIDIFIHFFCILLSEHVFLKICSYWSCSQISKIILHKFLNNLLTLLLFYPNTFLIFYQKRRHVYANIN